MSRWRCGSDGVSESQQVEAVIARIDGGELLTVIADVECGLIPKSVLHEAIERRQDRWGERLRRFLRLLFGWDE